MSGCTDHARNTALQRDFDGLRQMAPTLADLAREGEAMGLSPAVHGVLRSGIESLVRQLDLLR